MAEKTVDGRGALIALALLGCAVVDGALLLPGADVWSHLVAAISLLGVVGFVMLGKQRGRLLRPSALGVALGVLSAVALYAAAWVVTRWTPVALQAQSVASWHADHSAGFLIGTVTAAVVGEELFWRGAVTGRLLQRLPSARGAVVGAGIFAVAHLASGTWLLPAAAFGAGLVWNLLLATTRNLTASFVSHLAFDLLVVVFVPLP